MTSSSSSEKGAFPTFQPLVVETSYETPMEDSRMSRTFFSGTPSFPRQISNFSLQKSLNSPQTSHLRFQIPPGVSRFLVASVVEALPSCVQALPAEKTDNAPLPCFLPSPSAGFLASPLAQLQRFQFSNTPRYFHFLHSPSF
ncbi:hypothetical protein V8G54_007661 [Vigna mungo]|uniref:Uncharacterized protein n=1 Tax=Vigna mungo TaxID=3915 RepID=A0AAQ3P224_VIGMU